MRLIWASHVQLGPCGGAGTFAGDRGSEARGAQSWEADRACSWDPPLHALSERDLKLARAMIQKTTRHTRSLNIADQR